jgi:membrane fusion protein (multidrug efflux system)
MRTYTLLLLALVACTKGSAASNPADGPPEPLVKVPLVAVESVDAPVEIAVTGSVRPNQSSMVASDIAGRTLAVMVDVGVKVKQGDPLIRLDTSNAQLSAQEMNAQLAAAKAQWTMSDADCKRAADLLQKGAITKQEYDRETTNCTSAMQNVAAMEARVRQVGKQITDGVVRAPFSGVISQKLVEVGEWVSPGARVVELQNDDPLKVTVDVPESAATYVALNQPVSLQSVSFPGKTFNAKITKVGVSLTTMPRALVCEATIDPGTPLVPGMFVTVLIVVDHAPMPAVPKEALAQRGTTWRLWADVKGHLEERVVQLGPELPNGKFAIADGVKAGEKVAAKVTEQVADGARVE